MDDDEKLEEIAGLPIRITDGTIMHVRLFHSPCGFRDIWAEEHHDPQKASEGAAQLFIDQLGGHWNGAFLMALRRAITRKLAEHDKEFGTKWAEEG